MAEFENLGIAQDDIHIHIDERNSFGDWCNPSQPWILWRNDGCWINV